MSVECAPQGGYSHLMADAPQLHPDHLGHRARLRARLLDGGGDCAALADYELVEYLLSLAIPRRDIKPLAKALLREFGSSPN
jgi:DNA repair protein RadC